MYWEQYREYLYLCQGVEDKRIWNTKMFGDSINGILINSIEKYQPDVIYLYLFI